MSVNPPSATPTVHTTTGTAADLRLTRFTAEDVTLTPNEQSSTYFMWTNTADKDTVTTGARNHTFTAPTEEKTITYYFLATNDPEAPEGNLISNGTFEKPVIRDDSLESMYAFWGRDNIEYYTTHPNVSGGYAITDNANTFWHEFQTVKAHEGSYFGLFDSKIYDGTDQAAWIARSGSKNPKLKVISGVSYLFSFWVANINAYYQMNNGARLQFQISYDGGANWNDLGGEINLSNFKDSRWHGMSSLVTPTISSTNVVLRVINNNKSSKNIGNDFALDDIRFEAITPNSSYIAGYESFPVTYLKCVINSATFEQRQRFWRDFTANFLVFIHVDQGVQVKEGPGIVVEHLVVPQDAPDIGAVEVGRRDDEDVLIGAEVETHRLEDDIRSMEGLAVSLPDEFVGPGVDLEQDEPVVRIVREEGNLEFPAAPVEGEVLETAFRFPGEIRHFLTPGFPDFLQIPDVSPGRLFVGETEARIRFRNEAVGVPGVLVGCPDGKLHLGSADFFDLERHVDFPFHHDVRRRAGKGEQGGAEGRNDEKDSSHGRSLYTVKIKRTQATAWGP